MGKSRVRVVQMGEVHGVGVYEEERSGLKIVFFVFVFGFLQWSHESSLPVSRTMVTLCGGVPTVSETVNVTLWRNKSLRGEANCETRPCGSVWVLRGNMRTV